MHNQIVTSTKRTRVINSTAAGTSSVNGTHVDMQGFESVVFEACLGALTASQVTKLKAQAGNAADDSDMADLVGAVTAAMADGDSNKMLVLEVVRPSANGLTPYRYVRCVLVRGTANAAIDSVVATQYGSRKQPETDDSTVSQGLVAIEPLTTSTGYTNTTTTPSGTNTQVNNTYRSAS